MRISDWSSDVCSSDLVVIGPGIAGHTEHALGQLVAVDLARPATDRRGACRKPGTRPARFFESCGSLSVDQQLEQFLLILLPDQLRDGPLCTWTVARCQSSEEHTSNSSLYCASRMRSSA